MGIFETSDPKGESNAEDALRAVDSVALHDTVLAAVRRGWLLSFGRGRDGFALSITVIVDGEKSRAWCENTEDAERALNRVLTAATDVDGEVKPPPAKKARKAK